MRIWIMLALMILAFALIMVLFCHKPAKGESYLFNKNLIKMSVPPK